MRLGKLFIVMAIALLESSSVLRAVPYAFLPVTGNGIAGNAATSQFASQYGNGVINVTHAFSAGGAGLQDNDNPAIFPSQFTTLFPGTGQVQGHLAQTVYANTSVVTFDMTAYNISANTIFGIWNITNEVSPPPGGNPVYRIELIDSNNGPQAPSMFLLYGNQDNQTQVQGEQQLTLNPGTGELFPGIPINGGINGPDTHTDAAFYYNIPPTTLQIKVYGDLPALNPIGDGVGYYFAEQIPEPGLGAMVLGTAMFGTMRRRRLP